jgi:hypothetical protein
LEAITAGKRWSPTLFFKRGQAAKHFTLPLAIGERGIFAGMGEDSGGLYEALLTEKVYHGVS